MVIEVLGDGVAALNAAKPPNHELQLNLNCLYLECLAAGGEWPQVRLAASCLQLLLFHPAC